MVIFYVCNDGANLRKKSELRKRLGNYLIQVPHGLNLFFFSTETLRHRAQCSQSVRHFVSNTLHCALCLSVSVLKKIS